MYVVITVKEDKDGQVKMTREELEKKLNEAYDRGFEEGKKTNYINWNPTITTTQWPKIYYNSKEPFPEIKKYEITCEE